jgi:hypothetical protein
MTTGKWKHRRTLITRLLASGIVFFFLFLLGVYLSRQLDLQLSSYVQELLRRVKSKYGLQISVGSMEAGFGRIVLSDIGVGETNWLVIDRAEIKVSAIPWRDFLRPSDVSLDRATLKLPWNRAMWPQDVTEFIRRLEKGQSERLDMSSGGTGRLMPSFVKLHAAHVQIFDGDTPKILMDGLSAFGHLRERKLTIQLRHVKALKDVDDEFIEADLGASDPERWQFTLKHRQGFRGHPDWTTQCEFIKSAKQTSCDVNATVLPEFLVKRGQRFFGPAFAPGYQGRMMLQVNGLVGDRWIDVGLNGTLSQVSGEHPVIGTGIVGPANFGIQAKFQASITRRQLLTNHARVTLLTKADVPQEGITLTFDADLSWPSDSKKPQGEVSFAVIDLACKQALAALPENFVPELSQFKLGGTAELHGVTRLDGFGAEVQIKNSRFHCIVTQAPEIYTAAYLNAPFMIERDAENGKILIPVDPARPHFAAFDKIPPLVRAAFVASEDAGFFQHKGVEIGAIVGAAERNAQAGRAAVGGSTITMQTVKNLFLARDKTILRKAQEMFLAWHLEREISKQRILEIYLNMVEFGPGLYGIGHASQRFFNKDPSQLTLKEAAYLASLLPAPLPRYRYFCKGALTPNYERIVRQLLDRMRSLGRISVDEHAAAIEESLVFSKSERDESCGSKIGKAGDSENPARSDNSDLDQE